MPASSAYPGSDHLRFAYWVPNVSGGLVTSTVEQRTDRGYDYNRELAVLAENNGFDYALSQVRYMAGNGAEYQRESTSFSLALLLATQRLKVIAAAHPGLWHPAVLAKLGATADHLPNGRFAVNVVSTAPMARTSTASPSRSPTSVPPPPKRAISTPEQIAERSVAYKRLGVDLLLLLGFLHYLEEAEYFGKRVLPLVRELEAQEAASEPAAAHV
ncbi:LLM class flavin-dependent oxidoreductase [Streptomyces sparsogenes]|uniref:LLM class flavin-dependent oxidoreductase n=1 Tax=Streptomyces sparsogenes TaxID=67365 RepID=UPI0033F67EF9